MGPSSPFPDSVEALTLPLPLPVPNRIGDPDTTELIYSATKISERTYSEGGYSMVAAAYTIDTNLGSQTEALLTNALTQKVEEAVGDIVTALARYLALKYAYDHQIPPLPMPDNPGLASPWKGEMILCKDGTSRFRGYCAGIALITPEIVSTVDIGFGAIWGEDPPPP